MKRLVSSSVGLLLLLALPGAHAASLYDMVKKSMDLELRAEDVEDEVATFVEKIAEEKKWDITEEEVKSIVRGSTDVCSKHEKLNGFGCIDILKEIREMVMYENQVRLAGRKMQAIATEYELPISELPRKTATLSADLTGVINIWKAGGTSVQAAPKTIPSITIDGDDEKEKIKSLLQNLREKYDELDDEEKIAAVWRYQYGKRLVRGERAPDYDAPSVTKDGEDCDTTERRLLCKRWEDIENALDAIWTEIRQTYGSKEENPAVFYLALPDDLQQELPENVIVWMRMDKDARHPQGDVGLQWEFPVDPVLPALTHEGKPILGGTYPPEPPQREEKDTKKRLENERNGNTDLGSGVCSMAFAAKGYLCRSVSVESPAECPEPDDADKDAIVLVSCTFHSLQQKTLAGPDVCSGLAWNVTSQASASSQGSSSSMNPSCGCSYTVTCQSTCGGEGDGSASLKDENGNISVCIGTTPTIPVPRKYVLSHELAHVRQFCGLPPGAEPTATKEGCCSYEYDAHAVECAEMEADGLFAGSGFSASDCADILSNASCQRYGENACATVKKENKEAFIKAISREDVGSCPVTDEGKKKEINMCPCTPETLSKYGNTIGNNLCFIGQCVEQSLDTHRLTPGRTPAGVQDGAFPNDDALTGSPLGNFLTSPATGQPILPPYRPLEPVREFEAALCALVGLPTTVPSALCAIAASEDAGAPATDPLSSLLNMAQNRAEEELSLADFSTLAQSVGTRLGTDLYARNIRMMSKSLSEVLGTASSLLNEVKSIDFPTDMCPLGPAGGAPSEPAPQ